MNALVLILAMIGTDTKHETYPTYNVATLEVNHYYNSDGNHILSQLIIRDDRFQVQGWTLMKDIKIQEPTKEQKDAMKNWRDYPKNNPLRKAVEAAYPNPAWYPIILSNGPYQPIRNSRLRRYEVRLPKGRLRAVAFIETWTQYDRELEARKELPKNKRNFQKLLDEIKTSLYVQEEEDEYESTLCTPEDVRMDKLGHPVNLPT